MGHTGLGGPPQPPSLGTPISLPLILKDPHFRQVGLGSSSSSPHLTLVQFPQVQKVAVTFLSFLLCL